MIGIREFLELLALDCLDKPFLPDTGTPVKKIYLLDEFNYRETVSNFCALFFSSSASIPTEVITMGDIGHVWMIAVLGNDANMSASWWNSYSNFEYIILDEGVV